jgi:predicted amidohydrolase YtcJ
MIRLLAFACVLLTALPASGQQAADLAIINAKLPSSDKQIQAVAIVGEKISAVGSNADINRLIGDGTRVIDARGRLLLPGFNDSHVHFMAIGNKFSTLDLKEIGSSQELLDRIKHYARFLPKGRWILGSGGSDALFKAVNGSELDAASPGNPLFLYNKKPATALANSFAIRNAGVSGTSPGIVSGPALDRVRRSVPSDHTRRWAEIAETASNCAVSYGITSVQDTDSDDHAALYREMARDGRLKVRIYDCHGLPGVQKYIEAGLKAASGDAMVRTGCLKGTAEDDSDLLPRVIAADKAGMQVLLHAIGEEQVRKALDVFEAAARANGNRDRRFRIEHATRFSATDVPRFSRSSLIASVQPHLLGGLSYAPLQHAGIRVALGSDAPMAGLNPLLTIGEVVSKGFTSREAIVGYTDGSAYAEFQENAKGALEPGRLADLVILSDNILTVGPDQIGNSKVVLTIVNGFIVYEDN